MGNVTKHLVVLVDGIPLTKQQPLVSGCDWFMEMFEYHAAKMMLNLGLNTAYPILGDLARRVRCCPYCGCRILGGEVVYENLSVENG